MSSTEFPTSKSDDPVRSGETDRSRTTDEFRFISAMEDEDEDVTEAEEILLKMLLSPSKDMLCRAVDVAFVQDLKGVAFNLDCSFPSSSSTIASTSGFSTEHLEAHAVLEEIQALFHVNQDFARLFEDLQLVCTCEVLNEQLWLVGLESENTNGALSVRDRIYRDTEAVVVSMEKPSGNDPQFTLEIQQALQALAALLPNTPVIYIGAGTASPAANAPINTAVTRTPDVELSDTVAFEASYTSDPVNLLLRLEATGAGLVAGCATGRPLVEGSDMFGTSKLGLRMKVDATPGLVLEPTLESMRYAAQLKHQDTVDEWDWDENWTHNSGRARQDTSETRTCSSHLGIENRGVAATLDFGRERTTTTPAVAREATTSHLNHIEISVFYTLPDKKILDCEPTGTCRDWGFLNIPSLVSWNYDLLLPVNLAIEMSVQARYVAPVNRLIRSRYVVIGKMTAHLPTSSRTNKMRLEVIGEALQTSRTGDEPMSCAYSISESVRRGEPQWWKNLTIDAAALPSSNMAFILARHPLVNRWWSPWSSRVGEGRRGEGS
jgi:hypothetical protein